MSHDAPHSYEFGRFVFEARDRRLSFDGTPIDLTPKTADVLLALLDARGHLVTRDELDRRVWGDTVVGLGSLTFQIHLLRRALAVDHEASRYIETVPRRGYRFRGPLRVLAPADIVNPARLPAKVPASLDRRSLSGTRWCG